MNDRAIPPLASLVSPRSWGKKLLGAKVGLTNFCFLYFSNKVRKWETIASPGLPCPQSLCIHLKFKDKTKLHITKPVFTV